MIDCSKMFKEDKGCHFVAGLVITLIVGFITYVELGVLAGLAAGFLKEAWDEYTYGGFDTLDMLYTFIGSFFGGLLVVLFT